MLRKYCVAKELVQSNLVPRVFSLSNMAAAGAAILESEKTLGTRLSSEFTL